MKHLWIVFIIVATGIIISFYRMTPPKQPPVQPPEKRSEKQLGESRRFSCPDMKGFSFSYPVFKHWTPAEPVRNGFDSCVILMDWPQGIAFEIAPQIRVKKLTGLRLTPQLEASAKRNPQGVAYAFTTDPSLYAVGHAFKPGDWDYLEFYLKEFGVRISLMSVSQEFGFDIKAFTNTVIKTFAQTPE